eukprot:SAG31_NODE_1654_length_7621_cov_3.273597_5_plen_77_part_00
MFCCFLRSKSPQDVQRRFDALTGKAAAMGCSEFEQTLEAARSAAAAERQAMVHTVEPIRCVSVPPTSLGYCWLLRP